MSPRTVTIHATTNNLVGDETFEAWLKHAGAWALVDAGDVEQIATTQDFVFPGLIDGDAYSLQLRMKRTGRYRVGYLSSDPDSWPAQSRIDFTPGSLIGVGAPVLTAVDNWERLDVDSSRFVVHITPDDLDTNLELIDNGVLIHTFVAPLTATIDYTVTDPTLNIDHEFKARHIAGTLGGPMSNIITKYAGIGPVTGFSLSIPSGSFAEYQANWTDDGRRFRLEDDFPCPSTTFYLVDADADLGFKIVHKGILDTPDGPTLSANVTVRIRAEIDHFSTTDVSDWIEASIAIDIDADDTEFGSCP